MSVINVCYTVCNKLMGMFVPGKLNKDVFKIRMSQTTNQKKMKTQEATTEAKHLPVMTTFARYRYIYLLQVPFTAIEVHACPRITVPTQGLSNLVVCVGLCCVCERMCAQSHHYKPHPQTS